MRLPKAQLSRVHLMVRDHVNSEALSQACSLREMPSVCTCTIFLVLRLVRFHLAARNTLAGESPEDEIARTLQNREREFPHIPPSGRCASRAQTVHLWTAFSPFGLTLNEEQIPQIVENNKNQGAR